MINLQDGLRISMIKEKIKSKILVVLYFVLMGIVYLGSYIGGCPVCP